MEWGTIIRSVINGEFFAIFPIFLILQNQPQFRISAGEIGTGIIREKIVQGEAVQVAVGNQDKIFNRLILQVFNNTRDIQNRPEFPETLHHLTTPGMLFFIGSVGFLL